MEKIYTNEYPSFSKETDNIYMEEYQIIKNERIYNIKCIKQKKDNIQTFKIIASFVINNTFQIYEGNLDIIKEIDKSDNSEQFYQQIFSLIREEKLEIIHQDKHKGFIILKIEDVNKTHEIKLFPSTINEKNKLEKLTLDYISLEKNFIQLKNQIKNNTTQNLLLTPPIDNGEEVDNNNMEEDEENDNSSYHSADFKENNNIVATNYENIDENHILLDIWCQIWCMLKLNKISYIKDNNNFDLFLVALGFSNGKIIIINLNSLKIHQELKAPNTVYSLCQFKDDSKYLICSLSNGKIIIYILKESKYEEYEILVKPFNLRRGEINKVITLSNGNLATAERGVISIWKPYIEEGLNKFEFFKELITDDDTCQLLELNPEVFACAIYSSKLIKIYKNDGNEYPLIGKIKNVESHGKNSNGMCKINNKIFCVAGRYGHINIISIHPLELIQQIKLSEGLFYVRFVHNSNDGFIFSSIGDEIIQYKIIKDDDDNFIRIEKFNTIEDGENNIAVITTDDGKILYRQILKNLNNKINLFLSKYNK